jgi:hypothetical protein
MPKTQMNATRDSGSTQNELRRLGFKILNRTKEVDGARHSWFRLETGAPIVVSPKTPASVPAQHSLAFSAEVQP